jgi:Cu+-exporting ATPase
MNDKPMGHCAHHGHHGHSAHATVPVSDAPAPAPGTRYTCPMHPEIVRDAPGSCPICGMAL